MNDFHFFFAQVAPQGQKTCKAACNGVGTCNADTGLCDCPAGEENLPHMLSIEHAAQMPADGVLLVPTHVHGLGARTAWFLQS